MSGEGEAPVLGGVVDYKQLAAGEPAPAPVAPPPAQVEPVKEAAQPEQPKADEQPKEPVPVTGHESIDKSFKKLAAEKAALRQREQALEQFEQSFRAFGDSGRMQAVAKALASGDPLSLLAAAGMNYQQLVTQLRSGETPKREAPQADEEPVAVKQLREEVEALKAMQTTKVVEEQRKGLIQRMRSEKGLIPEDCTHIRGLEAEEEVIDALESFYRQTAAADPNGRGRLPAETVEESIAMAARVVEANLKAQAEKFKKVLTPAQPAPTMQPAGPASPAGQERLSPVLSNRDVAPGHNGFSTGISQDVDYAALAREALAQSR